MIGKQARNISPANAHEYILVFQPSTMALSGTGNRIQYMLAKLFWLGLVGPWITPLKDLVHPSDLELTVRLNGEVVQKLLVRI